MFLSQFCIGKVQKAPESMKLIQNHITAKKKKKIPITVIVPAYVKYLSELIPRAYKRLPGKIFLRLYTQEDVGIVD